MEQQKAEWIRFAVNGDRIRAGSPYGWRAFIGNEGSEIPLKGWMVEDGSLSSSKNPVPAFIPKANKQGMLAWVAYFAIHRIEDGIMYIRLEEPLFPPSWDAQQ